MGRTQASPFRSQRLAELTRQLLHGGDRRAMHVRRAETLHDTIDPERAYPLEFVIYRITGYRRDVGDNALLVGEALRPDLRQMIDTLSRATPLVAVAGEAHETAEQLAARLDVSTKTLSRWRRQGLRWRWVRDCGQRPRIAFTAAAVEDFLNRHGQRVTRASAFSQIPAEQRERIIQRARRLAEQRDVSLNQVAAHLARRTGRALETIRQILERYDRQGGDERIFRDRTGPLTPQQKRVIARAYRMGIPVSRLARRFARTRSTVHRVIAQQRAAAARRLELMWIEMPTFHREDADAVLLREARDDGGNDDGGGGDGAGRTVPSRVLAELPAAVVPLYAQPIMAPAASRSLFIRFNYLKFKADRARSALDRLAPRHSELDRFERCVRDAEAIRDRLVRGHMPVVLLAVRRHLLSETQPSPGRLMDLLQRGQAVLIEAVQSFNPTRGRSFEAFLTNRLLQDFATDAQAPDDARARRRIDGEQMRDRLVRGAAAAGVDLVPQAKRLRAEKPDA